MNFRILLPETNIDSERNCPLIFSIYHIAEKSNVLDVLLMINPSPVVHIVVIEYLRYIHSGDKSSDAVFERKI
jgi:hypothetical protein